MKARPEDAVPTEQTLQTLHSLAKPGYRVYCRDEGFRFRGSWSLKDQLGVTECGYVQNSPTESFIETPGPL